MSSSTMTRERTRRSPLERGLAAARQRAPGIVPAMALFELTQDRLVEVEPTTFSAAGVWERRDLQAALRNDISVIDRDLMVVAEEFGDFEESSRRINLLCVDREARLVVVELKRTTEGGHMEQQALRYAAMVSAMTFDELVDIYQRFLRKTKPDQREHARRQPTEWLDEAGEEGAVLAGSVQIILASADIGTRSPRPCFG